MFLFVDHNFHTKINNNQDKFNFIDDVNVYPSSKCVNSTRHLVGVLKETGDLFML